jgi:hypothetical protein
LTIHVSTITRTSAQSFASQSGLLVAHFASASEIRRPFRNSPSVPVFGQSRGLPLIRFSILFVSSLLLEILAIAYHSSIVLNNVHASAAAFQIQFSVHGLFRQRNVIVESITEREY